MPQPAASARHTRIDVQSNDTEPMSPQQRDQAISALAALIRAWSASDLTGRAHGALPLPLHRARSDTDHAGHVTLHRR
ncbi:MAG: hypothetical protein ACYCO9_23335 [Streptosporangiaceae bacterium]